MTSQHVAEAWQREGLEPAHKLVLLALSDGADRRGLVAMSQRDLAFMTGLSRDLSASAISALIDAAAIKEVRQSQGRAPTVFQVLTGVPRLTAKEPKETPKTIIPQRKPDIVEEKHFAPVKPPEPVHYDAIVERILSAAGITRDKSQPFYWMRTAHRQDALELIEAAGSIEALLAQLRAADIEDTGIRRLTALKRYIKAVRK